MTFKPPPIGWFPGHMKKAVTLIEKNLKGSSLIIEIVDARIPYSSRSRLIERTTRNQPRLIILNKSDLADESITLQWKHYFKSKQQFALIANSKAADRLKQLKVLTRLIKQVIYSYHPDKQHTQLKNFKIVIVGIPNVGKSSYINYLCGRKKTRVGNKPGVTRGKQLIQVTDELLLVDMPGLLDHKLDDEIGHRLALLGFIKDELIDFTDLGLWLTQKIVQKKFLIPDQIFFSSDENTSDPKEKALTWFHQLGIKKGCLLKNREVNLEKTGFLLTQEIRAGKWGRISLESPEKLFL